MRQKREKNNLFFSFTIGTQKKSEKQAAELKNVIPLCLSKEKGVDGVQDLTKTLLMA
jgi:hypothetical protein